MLRMGITEPVALHLCFTAPNCSTPAGKLLSLSFKCKTLLRLEEFTSLTSLT